MSRFSTRINSLHILGNFNGSWVWRRFDNFCGRKAHLFGSCLFTHDWASTSNKKVGWIQQQFVTLARLGDRDMPGHCLGIRSQTEFDCWKTETEIGTPARVEAETWKFARQRSSLRALGTRGLYVLWNYYAANSHAATPGWLRCDFSSDPAVSSSIFVEAEWIESEENLKLDFLEGQSIVSPFSSFEDSGYFLTNDFL